MKKILLTILPLLLIVGFSDAQTHRGMEFYESGEPKSINTYKESRGKLKLVKAVSWHPNGQKKFEDTYKDGKFNCFDGSKSIDASWVNDRECDCSDCSDEPLR
jgi:antitoxin component YwqK of YwqJK toxin-antitoxin module